MPETTMTLPGADALPDTLQQALREAYRAEGADYKPRTRHFNADGTPRYYNRLLLERSPYLQQHAHNPVNWYPWSDAAFADAARLQRPVFASFGYSTCHWCHVMEEESFDNPEIAEYLNNHFIAVKVDREARPDLDAIYMRAVQTMTGQGGWPLSVWLFPDRQPFYGGTYFPPDNRYGRPGFLTLLQSIVQAYRTQAEQLQEYAQNLSAAINRDLAPSFRSAETMPDSGPLRQAADFYRAHIDAEWGGIGEGVKFATNVPVRLLLRCYIQNRDETLLKAVRTTLDRMAEGGLYDHLGGGFHRYSTDARWLVPHFEKMLYDNAQLSLAYLEAYQLTGDAKYRNVVTETLNYILRDMTAPEGGFYSATDADSLNSRGEAEEGWYFTWTPEEIEQVLPVEAAAAVKEWYGVGKTGHLDGRCVLHTWRDKHSLAARYGMNLEAFESLLQNARQILLKARGQRPAPLCDDKIIVSWNGLMLAGFAKAGWVLQRRDYLLAAQQAARFILSRMLPEGRLTRIYLHGETQGPALLTDYAFLIYGLLELYQADGNAEWLHQALALQARQDECFLDDGDGVYCRTAADGERLLCREKPLDDGVMPSGNAMSAYNLLRLAKLSGAESYHRAALRLLGACSVRLRQQPLAMTEMLLALDFEIADGREIVLLMTDDSENREAMLKHLRQRFSPHDVLAVGTVGSGEKADTQAPLLQDRQLLDGKTTVYICRNRSCRLPVNTPEQLALQLQQ